MTSQTVMINGVQPTVSTPVEMYTSPSNGNGTRIIAFTASLISSTPQTYRVFIGASAIDANEIIPATSISREASTPAELINHLIPPGSKLFVQVSTGTAITFRATGVEF